MFFSWLNPTRLRVYPRLIAGTTFVILLLNVLLGQGWLGAVNQIIGGDFIMLYSSGVLFRQDPWKLYDYQQQWQIQRDLIAPVAMTGGMPPYNYPPYVAGLISLLSYIPLPYAFLFWTLFSIVAVVIASRFISRDLLPPSIAQSGLPPDQVFFVIASSLAFIEGLQVGQNHTLTLLCLTAAVVFSLRGKWFLAGVFSGLLVYKPHFALGLLIIWLIWQRWAALAGFGAVAFIWVGGFYLRYGWQLFGEYLSNGMSLLQMVYLDGFGGDLEVTPYGLLIDILPQTAWPGIVIFIQIFLVFASVSLAGLAWLRRSGSERDQIPVYMLAVLYPLIVSPHALLHDLLVIVPVLALWARLWPGRPLLTMTIAIFLATFIMPLITHLTGIALMAIIPLSLTILLVLQVIHKQSAKQPSIVI